MNELDWDKVQTVEDCKAIFKALIIAKAGFVQGQEPVVQFDDGICDKVPHLKTLLKETTC